LTQRRKRTNHRTGGNDAGIGYIVDEKGDGGRNLCIWIVCCAKFFLFPPLFSDWRMKRALR
jgi:hypothetical protein